MTIQKNRDPLFILFLISRLEFDIAKEVPNEYMEYSIEDWKSEYTRRSTRKKHCLQSTIDIISLISTAYGCLCSDRPFELMVRLFKISMLRIWASPNFTPTPLTPTVKELTNQYLSDPAKTIGDIGVKLYTKYSHSFIVQFHEIMNGLYNLGGTLQW